MNLTGSEKMGFALAKLEQWLEKYAVEQDLSLELLKDKVGEFFSPAKLLPVLNMPKVNFSKQVKSYWNRMTPDERKAEQARRRAARLLTPEQKKERRKEQKRSHHKSYPMGGIA
jgi:hypothetical protein